MLLALREVRHSVEVENVNTANMAAAALANARQRER